MVHYYYYYTVCIKKSRHLEKNYYTNISWSWDNFLIWIFYLGPNLSDDTVGIENISRMSEHNPLLCNRPKMHLRTELCSYSQCLIPSQTGAAEALNWCEQVFNLQHAQSRANILWQERQKWSNDSDTLPPPPPKKKKMSWFFFQFAVHLANT